MSEGKLSAVWDSCIADAVVKTGTGDNIILTRFLSLVFVNNISLPISITAVQKVQHLSKKLMVAKLRYFEIQALFWVLSSQLCFSKGSFGQSRLASALDLASATPTANTWYSVFLHCSRFAPFHLRLLSKGIMYFPRDILYPPYQTRAPNTSIYYVVFI